MEEIPSPKRRKIQETVLNILKDSDFETATEYSVRAAAAQLLRTDLSDLSHKCLVRQVLESFLLSTAPPKTTAAAAAASGDVNANRVGSVPEKTQEAVAVVRDGQQFYSDNGRVICKLSDKRSVAVHDYKGKALVSIRDYYDKDGKQVPSGRGISLTGKQWSLLRNSFPAIEEAIAKMASRIRLAAVKKESSTDLLVGDIAAQGILKIDQNRMETDISNSLDAVAPQRQIGATKNVGMDTNDLVMAPNGRHLSQANLSKDSIVDVLDHQRQRDGERKDDGQDVIDSVDASCSQGQTSNQRDHPQADTDTTTSAFAPRGPIPHNSVTSFTQGLIPIMTTRLDGKNYHCWVHQMEFFLKQLKVAYVLKDPCPSISAEATSFEEILQAKAAVQKWVDDEYICRHNILNSLSDHLFNQYSNKGCSAKELWEELKSFYDEDFGTVRSQINKYIQFQMVDGISVLEQAQELQRIVNSIMASGIWMDDNFHVSVIISKLPPSWKEYRAKLMQEEVLPLSVLMHRLKIEEESRKQQHQEESIPRNPHIDNSTVQSKSGLRKKEIKRVCYSCGKEGHISKHCPDRKSDTHRKCDEKENAIVPIVADVKMEENVQD